MQNMQIICKISKNMQHISCHRNCEKYAKNMQKNANYLHATCKNILNAKKICTPHFADDAYAHSHTVTFKLTGTRTHTHTHAP